jgi:hypothetical protein
LLSLPDYPCPRIQAVGISHHGGGSGSRSLLGQRAFRPGVSSILGRGSVIRSTNFGSLIARAAAHTLAPYWFSSTTVPIPLRILRCQIPFTHIGYTFVSHSRGFSYYRPHFSFSVPHLGFADGNFLHDSSVTLVSLLYHL